MAVWNVSVPPATEPLELEDVKNYLKVTFDSDDDLIADLVQSARVFVERHTSRALIEQTITEYFDEFPVIDFRTPVRNPLHGRIIELHIAPVSVIEADGISYVASGGDLSNYTFWDNTANSKYFLDRISGSNGIGPARICKKNGVDWPSVEPYANAVSVQYTAGYGAAADVPGPLKMAIRRLVGLWYYPNKGSTGDDFEAVKDLLNPYKVHK